MWRTELLIADVCHVYAVMGYVCRPKSPCEGPRLQRNGVLCLRRFIVYIYVCACMVFACRVELKLPSLSLRVFYTRVMRKFLHSIFSNCFVTYLVIIEFVNVCKIKAQIYYAKELAIRQSEFSSRLARYNHHDPFYFTAHSKFYKSLAKT